MFPHTLLKKGLVIIMMDQTRKIGVAIAGCGAITRTRHVPEYRDNSNVLIKGFYDYDLNRAKELADLYGGKAYGSYEELLNDHEVQAVSICTPNFLHPTHSIAAMEAGKDVLCEKPMAPTLEEARAMIDAQKHTGRVLMLGHNQRLVRTHILAKSLLDQGAIGKVLYLQTNFKHAGPEAWSIEKGSTWFFDKSKAKFGVLGDLGSHKLDLVRYLLQDEVDEIFTTLTTLDKRYPDGRLIDLDDNAVCLLKMKNGIEGQMHVSWTNYGPEDNSTVIYGTGGTIRIFATDTEDILIHSRDGSCARYQTGAISTNTRQLRSGIIDAFVQSVVEHTTPPVTWLDGYNTLACLEAAGISSTNGTWQKVALY